MDERGLAYQLCADADSAVLPLTEWSLPHAPKTPCTVLMHDPRPTRLQVVSRIISECGSRPRGIEAAATIPQNVLSYSCNLAVVALDSDPLLGNLDLENIRSLQ